MFRVTVPSIYPVQLFSCRYSYFCFIIAKVKILVTLSQQWHTKFTYFMRTKSRALKPILSPKYEWQKCMLLNSASVFIYCIWFFPSCYHYLMNKYVE